MLRRQTSGQTRPREQRTHRSARSSEPRESTQQNPRHPPPSTQIPSGDIRCEHIPEMSPPGEKGAASVGGPRAGGRGGHRDPSRPSQKRQLGRRAPSQRPACSGSRASWHTLPSVLTQPHCLPSRGPGCPPYQNPQLSRCLYGLGSPRTLPARGSHASLRPLETVVRAHCRGSRAWGSRGHSQHGPGGRGCLWEDTPLQRMLGKKFQTG